MALPSDVSGGVGGGDYFKLATGQNKILIVGEAVTGYEYWTNEDKPVRSKTKFNEPLENPKVRQVKNKKTGETENKVETQKFFWAIPVYDYKDESYKLWQITQKSIRENLASIQSNSDWGNPVGAYSISIDKKGEGLLTEYTVMANPTKDKKEIEKIVAGYKDIIDIDGALFS